MLSEVLPIQLQAIKLKRQIIFTYAGARYNKEWINEYRRTNVFNFRFDESFQNVGKSCTWKK